MNKQDKKAFEKRWREVEGEYECQEHYLVHKAETKETWEAAIAYERENNSPNEAYIKMLQDTVESQKKEIETLKRIIDERLR
jgi:hypothetical protein